MTIDGSRSPGRVVLCLSGGGLRATLFHLGVVRYLSTAGVLPSIVGVVGVSGGSVLAADLALHWAAYGGTDRSARDRDGSRREAAWNTAARRIVALAQHDVRGRIIRRIALTSLGGTFVRRWRSTGQLSAILDSQLYGKRTLRQLAPTRRTPTRPPRTYLLATNLVDHSLTAFGGAGHARFAVASWSQSRRDTDRPLDVPADTLPVAWATATSAAFPGLFEPVELDLKLLPGGHQDTKNLGDLHADGGVFDNTGLTGAMALFGLDRAEAPDAYIVVDASAPVKWERPGFPKLLTTAIRASDLLSNTVHDISLRQAREVGARLAPRSCAVMVDIDPTRGHPNLWDPAPSAPPTEVIPSGGGELTSGATTAVAARDSAATGGRRDGTSRSAASELGRPGGEDVEAWRSAVRYARTDLNRFTDDEVAALVEHGYRRAREVLAPWLVERSDLVRAHPDRATSWTAIEGKQAAEVSPSTLERGNRCRIGWVFSWRDIRGTLWLWTPILLILLGAYLWKPWQRPKDARVDVEPLADVSRDALKAIARSYLEEAWDRTRRTQESRPMMISNDAGTPEPTMAPSGSGRSLILNRRDDQEPDEIATSLAVAAAGLLRSYADEETWPKASIALGDLLIAEDGQLGQARDPRRTFAVAIAAGTWSSALQRKLAEDPPQCKDARDQLRKYEERGLEQMLRKIDGVCERATRSPDSVSDADRSAVVLALYAIAAWKDNHVGTECAELLSAGTKRLRQVLDEARFYKRSNSLRFDPTLVRCAQIGLRRIGDAPPTLSVELANIDPTGFDAADLKVDPDSTQALAVVMKLFQDRSRAPGERGRLATPEISTMWAETSARVRSWKLQPARELTTFDLVARIEALVMIIRLS